MKNSFDLGMKKAVQERVSTKIERLTRKEQVEYFRKASAAFWRRVRAARDRHPEPMPATSSTPSS